MNDESDIFVARFSNPHTAIPDWLIFRQDIRLEARCMAMAIIALTKRVLPPTKPEIAEAIGVDVRTVYRWLDELKAAGVCYYQRVGRRHMYVFSDQARSLIVRSDDPTITDHGDHLIVGSSDRGDHPDRRKRDLSMSDYSQGIGGFWSESITDPSGGGGGHDLLEESEPPTNHRAARTKVLPDDITTATGRWLVSQGFSLTSAHRFQSLPLAAVQADYERRRTLGQRHGAIVQAWRVESPEESIDDDEAAGNYTISRRTQLIAKYGDYVRFGDDLDGLEQEEE